MTISTRHSVVAILRRSKHSLAVQPIMGCTFSGQDYANKLWSNRPENKERGSG